MSLTHLRDIGSQLEANYAGFISVTAGGGNDGSEVSGPWIDKRELESGKVVIGYTTTLAETETLSLAANLQDATASDGSNSADYGSAVADQVVATGGTGGTTEVGAIEADYELREANQFIRVQFTPTMSAASTDTSDVMAVVVLGGADSQPLSNQLN